MLLMLKGVKSLAHAICKFLGQSLAHLWLVLVLRWCHGQVFSCEVDYLQHRYVHMRTGSGFVKTAGDILSPFCSPGGCQSRSTKQGQDISGNPGGLTFHPCMYLLIVLSLLPSDHSEDLRTYVQLTFWIGMPLLWKGRDSLCYTNIFLETGQLIKTCFSEIMPLDSQAFGYSWQPGF